MKLFATILILAVLAAPSIHASEDWQDRVYGSSLAYGRSPSEAAEASEHIRTILGLQIYLTLSTKTYETSHPQAIESVRRIRSYFSFQTYLTLRTPSYDLRHDQALRASEEISSVEALQLYLHLLVVGVSPEKALREIKSR